MKDNITLSKQHFIIAFLLGITLLRLFIGIKTPLYIQADAIYDDQLLVKYTMNILNGNWLGVFDALTLVKASSFSFLLAGLYLLGIPFSFALTSLYILACFLMSKAINKGINNPIFFTILYTFLLYSPVMFNEDMQNVYRDGFIVAFSMLVISSVIGIFFSMCNNEKSSFKRWLILETISLPIFWLLKEDSIWILPLVVVANLLSFWRYVYKNKNAKNIIIQFFRQSIPFILLLILIFSYKYTNYVHYGEYTITDRTGTYFKEVIADLIKIDDLSIKDPCLQDVWVTKDMLEMAADVSPSLKKYIDSIEAEYNTWTFTTNDQNGVAGDLFIWALRNGFYNGGLYSYGGEFVNSYYKMIHQELTDAFNNGNLIQNSNRIFLSPVVRGLTWKELTTYYKSRTPEVIKSIITYDSPELTKLAARGNYDDVVIFSNLINSDFIWNNTGNSLSDWQYRFIDIDNKIIRKAYSYTSYPIFILSCIGFLCLIYLSIREIKNKLELSNCRILIILLGFILTSVAMIFAVMWFCSYCELREIVNYTSSIVPMLQVYECVSVYTFINALFAKNPKEK